MTKKPEQESNGGSTNKITRVIEKYNLNGLGIELENRWLATDDQSMSLRELAEYFNKQVLEVAIERSDLSLVDNGVDTIYSRLTEKNTSTSDQIQVERRLEYNGVDVDTVTSDFVTHQTVYKYLRDYREVSQPEETPEQKRSKANERVQKLQKRTAAVTDDTLKSIQRDGLIPEGEFDVLVDIQIVFRDGDKYTISDLLGE